MTSRKLIVTGLILVLLGAGYLLALPYMPGAASREEAGTVLLEMHRAQLEGADLRGRNLFRASASNANFKNARMSGVNLSQSGLLEADFSGADLQDANISETDIRRANFTDANLAGADLTLPLSPGAIFKGANLRNALLVKFELTDVDLSGADMRGCRMTDSCCFEKCRGIRNANILGVIDPPAGFREWALQHGAIEADGPPPLKEASAPRQ